MYLSAFESTLHLQLRGSRWISLQKTSMLGGATLVLVQFQISLLICPFIGFAWVNEGDNENLVLNSYLALLSWTRQCCRQLWWLHVQFPAVILCVGLKELLYADPVETWVQIPARIDRLLYPNPREGFRKWGSSGNIHPAINILDLDARSTRKPRTNSWASETSHGIKQIDTEIIHHMSKTAAAALPKIGSKYVLTKPLFC